MKDPVLIGISYCGTHNKGSGPETSEAVRVTPRSHAEWLLASVDYWQTFGRTLDRDFRVIVSAVGLPGMLHITGEGERDIMWLVAQKATIVNWHDNPGHQVGASVAIRQGLECAGYWHYPLYLHTAEDILPLPGAVEMMLAKLDEGKDYAGWVWGHHSSLSSQFFACRTNPLAGIYDIGRVTQFIGLEHYLYDLLKDRPKHEIGAEGYYLTTHDWDQFKRWLVKTPESTHPPVVRCMEDYDKNRDYLEWEAKNLK